jgi:flagellar biosynthesis/type III secretory pathway protein FliH
MNNEKAYSKIIRKMDEGADIESPKDFLAKILTDKKIIKEKAWVIMNEAEKIIEQAEKIASEKIKQAEKIADQIKKEAYKEGYTKGITQALNFIKRARIYYSEVIKRTKDELIELVLRIAEKVIMEELRTEPAHILNIVKKMCKNFCKSQGIEIRVSCSDYELIITDNNLMQELKIINAKLIKEEAIERGDCIILEEGMVVDGSIKTRLKKIKEELVEL